MRQWQILLKCFEESVNEPLGFTIHAAKKRETG